jgi:predicted nucleic acid-binding protein
MSARDFVLDASTTLAWCFEDEASARAEQVLDNLADSEAFTPALWQLEVSNALLGAERRGRLTQAESARFLELLHQLPIRIEETPRSRPWSEVLTLAREHHLSAYDATYLDLAMRLGLPLATLDEELRQAAIHCGVGIV